MDFKTAFNLTDDMTHEEKYETIVNGLGYDLVKACIPFSLSRITEALKTDKHLNSLPLRTWDNATGYKTITTSSSERYIPTNNRLINLCHNKGITSYSLSDLVCILKHCAVMWAEENKPETKRVKKYLEMKNRHQKEWNDFPMFFAFSSSQFDEGMEKLGLKPSDTDKIYRFGNTGGYYRKSDAEALRQTIERHDRELKEAIASDTDGTGFAFDMFYYELGNHEYCVTYDISETLNALGYKNINEVKKNEQLFKALENARTCYLEEYNMF